MDKVQDFLGDKKWMGTAGRPDDTDWRAAIDLLEQLQSENVRFRTLMEGNDMAKQSMNNGVPECPDCDGKGMCIEHRVEFLQHEYEVARDAYEASMKEYIEILKERIEQK